MLPVSSLAGTILSGIFNYHDAPTLGEVIAWVGFLAVTLALFLKPEPAPAAKAPVNGSAKV
jgi:high-affinity iron transporter